MLLRRGEDEYRMCRRFLKSLKEGVERSGRQHVDLIDDVHAVLPDLRRNLHLVHQVLYVIHTIVGGGVQFMNTIGSAFLKRAAGLALAARIHLRRRIGAIDGFREYSCRGRLTHSARAAEKIGVGQLASDYGIFQGLGYVVLTDQGLKRVRTIFSR